MVIIFCLIPIAKTAVAQNAQIIYFRTIKGHKNRKNKREYSKQVQGKLKIEWLKSVQVTLVQ